MTATSSDLDLDELERLAMEAITTVTRAYAARKQLLLIAAIRERDAAIARLRRLVDRSLVLAHVVGANGGMTEVDHQREADIRREAGQP
jgi:hypothetical protein